MKQVRIISWNVNGLRAVSKHGFLEWVKEASPDILCLQETKVHPDQLPDELREIKGYLTYWQQPVGRKGYAGVATSTKEKPLEVRYGFGPNDLDLEGRVIATAYPQFTLFNIYFPNGKQGPERLKYKLEFYDLFLRHMDDLMAKGKGVIVCGDVNTAHKEIDIARPKANSKLSGFLPEERAWIDKFLAHGLVDTFRRFNQEAGQYTYWDIKTAARERNVGWRIDYFLVSENLMPSVTNSFIMPEVMGSDHCPIALDLNLP